MTTRKRWPTRAHGALQPLADNLWLVEGPVPGMLYKRQMVVARDAQRRLLLHSVIAMHPAQMAELEALGTPTWMVVPNGHHRLDAPAYKLRYPELRVLTPRGALERVRRVVAVDKTYDQFCDNEALQLIAAPWPDAAEGAVSVRSADGVSLVFNDLLWTPAARGAAGFLHKLLRQEPQVPWLARRLLAPKPTTILRDWLVSLAQTPDLARVIPGHGAPITRGAAQALQRVAARLL